MTPMAPVSDGTVAEKAFIAPVWQSRDYRQNEVPIVTGVEVGQVAARCDLLPQH